MKKPFQTFFLLLSFVFQTKIQSQNAISLQNKQTKKKRKDKLNERLCELLSRTPQLTGKFFFAVFLPHLTVSFISDNRHRCN